MNMKTSLQQVSKQPIPSSLSKAKKRFLDMPLRLSNNSRSSAYQYA